MGLVSNHKAKVAAKQQADLEQRRQAAVAFATTMLAILNGSRIVTGAFRPKHGELVINDFTPVRLFEPRSSGGHYVGHSSGVSVPVGGGVRLRYGQSRGLYVRNPEEPTVIDTGSVAITDQRMVFLGSNRTVEWSWAKLVGLSHDTVHGSTSVQVTNRQKVSGVVYGAGAGDHFRTCLEVALACFDGKREAAIAQLRSIAGGPSNDQLAIDDAVDRDEDKLPEATDGAPPVPAGAPPHALAAPAEWTSDPTGRHQYRYWNGSSWTEHVSDNGTTTVDPV